MPVTSRAGTSGLQGAAPTLSAGQRLTGLDPAPKLEGPPGATSAPSPPALLAPPATAPPTWPALRQRPPLFAASPQDATAHARATCAKRRRAGALGLSRLRGQRGAAKRERPCRDTPPPAPGSACWSGPRRDAVAMVTAARPSEGRRARAGDRSEAAASWTTRAAPTAGASSTAGAGGGEAGTKSRVQPCTCAWEPGHDACRPRSLRCAISLSREAFPWAHLRRKTITSLDSCRPLSEVDQCL